MATVRRKSSVFLAGGGGSDCFEIIPAHSAPNKGLPLRKARQSPPVSRKVEKRKPRSPCQGHSPGTQTHQKSQQSVTSRRTEARAVTRRPPWEIQGQRGRQRDGEEALTSDAAAADSQRKLTPGQTDIQAVHQRFSGLHLQDVLTGRTTA